jgi:RNA polymerase sigma-70 factor (ECF subfamily)
MAIEGKMLQSSSGLELYLLPEEAKTNSLRDHTSAQDGGGQSGSTGSATAAVDADRIAAAFLHDEREAVVTVTAWARAVADHRAWGFETPDDIVQEVLLALVRNFRGGRFVGGDLRAYVRRITKNICVSSYRKARTRGTAVPLEEAAATVPGTDGEDAVRRAEVKRILAGLDEPCRRLITLAYLHGLSRKEIARRFAISEGAAKVRLFRCLERARAMQGNPPDAGDLQ